MTAFLISLGGNIPAGKPNKPMMHPFIIDPIILLEHSSHCCRSGQHRNPIVKTTFWATVCILMSQHNMSEYASSGIKMKALPARSCVGVCVCVSACVRQRQRLCPSCTIVLLFEFKGEEAREKISCTRGNSPFGKLMKAVNTGRGSHWQSKHFLERQDLL